MDPTQRDKDAENLIAGFIRGPGGAPDVTEFLNNSGEGDPELARRDGSGEGEAYDIVEGDDDGEADGSHEREADGSGRTLDITNSGEVHIYMLIK